MNLTKDKTTESVLHSKKVDYNPFAEGEIEMVFPVTPSQRVYLELSSHGLTAAIAAQNGMCLYLRGNVNIDALQATAGKLISRHPSLRGVFNKETSQFLIQKHMNIQFESFTIDANNRINTGTFLEPYLKPFDIYHGPLIRFLLFRIEPQYYVFFLVAHQAVCDPWSLDVLIADLAAIYTALLNGKEIAGTYSDLLYQYMVEKQKSWGSSEYKVSLQTIKATINNARIQGNSDAIAANQTIFCSERIIRSLTPAEVVTIRDTARRLGCSIFTLLSYVFGNIIRKKIDVPEILLGITAAGQLITNNNDLVGQCTTHIPCIYPVPKDLSPSRNVLEFNNSLIKALDYQHCGYFDARRDMLKENPGLPYLLTTGTGMSKRYKETDLKFEGLAVDYEFIGKPYDVYRAYLHGHDGGQERLDLEFRFAPEFLDTANANEVIDQISIDLKKINTTIEPAGHPPVVPATENKADHEPEDNLHGELRSILEEISGQDLQSTDTSTTFLEMGMDSLLLTQVSTVLKDRFDVKLSFRQLLSEYATIDQLAHLIAPASSPGIPNDSSTKSETTKLPDVYPQVSETQNLVPPHSADETTGTQALLYAIIERHITLISEELNLLQGVREGLYHAGAAPSAITLKHESLPVLSSTDNTDSEKMLYIDKKNGRLFGVLHQPHPEISRSHSILLCYPGPQESMRMHRAFRQLSSALCKSGFHVLRFDYTGTGDSSGADKTGCPEVWIEDIRDAFGALQQRLGTNKLSAVAARLGALLLGRALQSTIQLHSAVLWDPVVDGNRYIEQLHTLHQQHHKNSKGPSTGPSTDHELLGYYFDDNLKQQTTSLNLDVSSFSPDTKLHLCTTEQSEAISAIVASNGGSRIDHHFIQDGRGWDSNLQFDDSLLLNRSITKITAILSGVNNG